MGVEVLVGLGGGLGSPSLTAVAVFVAVLVAVWVGVFVGVWVGVGVKVAVAVGFKVGEASGTGVSVRTMVAKAATAVLIRVGRPVCA